MNTAQADLVGESGLIKLAQAFPEAFLSSPPRICSHDSRLSGPGRCSQDHADGPSARRRYATLTMNKARFAAFVTPVVVTFIKSSKPQYCLGLPDKPWKG